MKQLQPSLIALGVSAMVAAAGGAHAAGFALVEQSGSGTGNAFAGAAASAEDASTIFFNPAGMAYLPGAQVVVAGHGVDFSAKCDNCTSTRPLALGGGTNTGGTGGDAGVLSFVPNVYASLPIGQRFSIGVGINAPFGLKTEYDDSWVGRFQGIESEVKTINVNPAVAFKVSDALSIGAGVNYQTATATLTNAAVLGAGLEGRAKLDVDGTAWGWNLGGLWQPAPGTRIGASYRSELKYSLDGTTSVSTLSGAPVSAASGPTKVDITFPDMASLSLAQMLNDRWQLLADVTYTWWGKIGQVAAINSTNNTIRDNLAFNFDNAWRVSVGANYTYSDTWKFRGGLAWDQSPVKDDTRTVRLPDNDRYWLALGAQWRFTKSTALDIGYAHLFIPDADINFTRSQTLPTGAAAPGTASTVTGTYKGSVDIFSLQLAVTF
jgi:long-chain fatty acid transport protein